MKLSYPSNKICPYCSTGGYVWYLEGSEYVAKCTNCGHYFHKEDFPMCVLDSTPKPTTNADRIRSMTDEELAELFEMIPHSGNPPTYTIDGFCIDDGLRTKRQWLDWLKQEVKDG